MPKNRLRLDLFGGVFMGDAKGFDYVLKRTTSDASIRSGISATFAIGGDINATGKCSNILVCIAATELFALARKNCLTGISV